MGKRKRWYDDDVAVGDLVIDDAFPKDWVESDEYTLPEEQLHASFELSPGTEVRVRTFRDYHERLRVDIRLFAHKSRSGRWVAGRKGISIPTSSLNELREALGAVVLDS